MTAINEKIWALGLMPVAVIPDAKQAVPLARALAAGGLPMIEVTFRTSGALEGIREIARQVPAVLPGAGTVLDIQTAEAAVSAGAQFIVTPGLNPQVVRWCQEREIPVYPGIATPTELAEAVSLGIDTVKFFPAEQSGGISMLKALSAPFPQIQFIPTGGITPDNLPDYLAMDQVLACGGSFIVPQALIGKGAFDEIAGLTRKVIANMLDIQLLHVGMNCGSEAEAQKAAEQFKRLFGLPGRETPGTIFAGSAAEILKAPYLGEHGHLAFTVRHMARAIAYLKACGIPFREDTIVRDDKGILAIYLTEEIAGFALHLRRRD